MDQLKELITPVLMSHECFDKLFIEFDFNDVECFKQVLSKGLGIGIILGSVLVKVPQIMKIYNGKSAAGITLLSIVLELFAITSNLAYSYCKGFSFSAWGEACFLALQTCIVGLLTVYYNYGSGTFAFSFTVAYISFVYTLVSEITPIDVLWSMQAANIPIIVFSKMLQATTNYRNKSTGQLSAITIFMLFAGSLARIFTSIQETGDNVVILTYMTASFVNGVISLQMIWYWRNKAPKTVTGKVKVQPGQGQPGKGQKGQNKKNNQKAKKVK